VRLPRLAGTTGAAVKTVSYAELGTAGISACVALDDREMAVTRIECLPSRIDKQVCSKSFIGA